MNLESGDRIPIEERSPDEVTEIRGRRIAPRENAGKKPGVRHHAERVRVGDYHRAGVARAPYVETLRALAAR